MYLSFFAAILICQILIGPLPLPSLVQLMRTYLTVFLPSWSLLIPVKVTLDLVLSTHPDLVSSICPYDSLLDTDHDAISFSVSAGLFSSKRSYRFLYKYYDIDLILCSPALL